MALTALALTMHAGMARAIKAPAVSEGKEKLRAYVLELFSACPCDPSNPPDCPLCSVRKLPPKERVRWLEGLTEADLAYLASYNFF